MGIGQVTQKFSWLFFRGSFGKIIGISFLFLFVMIEFLYGASLFIKEGDVAPAIEYLGPKFLTPVLTINKISLQIIEQEGAYQKTTPIWGGMWEYIKLIFQIFSSLYKVYLWIGVLGYVLGRGDISKWFRNYFIYGGITFLLIQWMFIGFMPEKLIGIDEGASRTELIMVPIKAFINLGKASYYILSPVSEYIEGTSVENVSINKSVT